MRLEEGDYLYSKQNMTGAGMRLRENPILGHIWSRKILTTDGKLGSPEEAQKEADSSQKEADAVWPKILISWQWKDDGQTVISPHGS